MAKNDTFAHVLLMGTTLRIKPKILYPNLPCAVRPIPHGPGVPILLSPKVLETVEDFVNEKSWSDSQLKESSEYECDDDQQSKPFNLTDIINDLVRDLNLPKESALILSSRLKAKRMLTTDTIFVWYKHCENKHIRFFVKEHSLVYSVDYKV